MIHLVILKGDEVLIKVAQSLKSFASRAADFVFRMGGEDSV